VPPLDYDLVYRLKQYYPDRFVGINGGISNLAEAKSHMNHVDGVMLGRAAYHNPELLRGVDQELYGLKHNISNEYLLSEMAAYVASHLAKGGRVNHVTRHMLGLFQGRPGARRFRQVLSVEACRPGADERVIKEAFAAVLDDTEIRA